MEGIMVFQLLLEVINMAHFSDIDETFHRPDNLPASFFFYRSHRIRSSQSDNSHVLGIDRYPEGWGIWHSYFKNSRNVTSGKAVQDIPHKWFSFHMALPDISKQVSAASPHNGIHQGEFL